MADQTGGAKSGPQHDRRRADDGGGRGRGIQPGWIGGMFEVRKEPTGGCLQVGGGEERMKVRKR